MGLSAGNDQRLVSQGPDSRRQPGQKGESMAYPEGCEMSEASQKEREWKEMKKKVSFILSIIMCLTLCACGSRTPSVETLVSLADQIVSSYKPGADAPYKLRSLGYDEEENTYMVAVMTDAEKVSQIISELDIDEKYADQAIMTAVSLHDRDTETITRELSTIKSLLDANFMDTDVVVMVGYFDQNGEIVQVA